MRKQGTTTEDVLLTKIISQLLPKFKKQSDTQVFSALKRKILDTSVLLYTFYRSVIEIVLTFPRHIYHYHIQVSLQMSVCCFAGTITYHILEHHISLSDYILCSTMVCLPILLDFDKSYDLQVQDSLKF